MKIKATSTYEKWPPDSPQTLKDLRADPLAFAAIHAFENLQQQPTDPLKTACIALVSSHWGTHHKKVLEACTERRVRAGSFIRMGPHTIATYLATAWELHGPTFALLDEPLEEALKIGQMLLASSIVSDVCIISVEETSCTVTLVGL
jgi:hypothetical protein